MASLGTGFAPSAIIGVALLAVGSIPLWLLYRCLSRRWQFASNKPKLSTVMATFFVGLSIPILIFIMAYNYHRNSEAMMATLKDDVAKTRQASIEDVEGMIKGVASTLRLLAGMVAADPNFFRTDESREVLFRALTSAEEIDAAFVSFEDGYHRAVTRIDDDRRRSDPTLPATANWHMNFIDGFSAGAARSRHRKFFDTWDHVVAEYLVPTTVDYRIFSGYPAAKASGALAVADPEINSDTGYPIINIRFPVFHNGDFIGCAGTSITLDVLARFLATHRASPHSTTIIADLTDAKIIGASDKQKSVRLVNGKLEIARLVNFADDDVREAHRLRAQSNQDDFLFRSPRDGQELSASFARFPETFGRPWQAIVITPTDDFIGPLKATNRQIVVIIIALSIAELFLIHLLSRRLSQPIEHISQELKAAESLSFEHHTSHPSKIREIAQLQAAASLLRNSLRSFSSFAPVDVVRGLIKLGIPLALGVEKRNLTVLFSDLEDFTTHAEQSTPDALLEQMSVYFEQVSRSISDEKGTVDKFIGDGIMAFWGAPVTLSDHALRACAGALRAARRIERANEAWRREGKPALRIRIGLNTADVLVGNVGSTERFSYTAMGDGVNVAARLEDMNKVFGTTICISDSVFDAVASEVAVRPLRRVQVKGRKQEFMVYELLGMAKSDDPELEIRPEDKKLSVMTWVASKSFENGDLSESADHYREILGEFPNDPIAKAMLAACSPRIAAAAAVEARARTIK
jgi:adenylate cyclase